MRIHLTQMQLRLMHTLQWSDIAVERDWEDFDLFYCEEFWKG